MHQCILLLASLRLCGTCCSSEPHISDQTAGKDSKGVWSFELQPHQRAWGGGGGGRFSAIGRDGASQQAQGLRFTRRIGPIGRRGLKRRRTAMAHPARAPLGGMADADAKDDAPEFAVRANGV